MIGKEKLNKKGFTLVEVLAVIVILGILSTIGTVSIINLRKKQEEKFNNTQLQIFKQTSQTYFSDNKSKLPTTPSGTETIYLKDLIDNNYIDELLDYRKNEYDRDKSYVKVTRVGIEAEYAYTPVLYKEGDEEKPIEENLVNNSKISFISYSKINKTNNNTLEKLGCEKATGNGTVKSTSCDMTNKNNDINVYYSNYTTRIEVKATNNDDSGIYGYRYEIFKNNKFKEGSKYIPIKTNDHSKMSDVITLSHSSYSDGKYKVRIIVYDKNATPKTANSIPIVIDFTKPICNIKKTPDKEWANKKDIDNGGVLVEGICKDSGSGCVSQIKKNFNAEMQSTINVGTVYDYAGNSNECGNIAVNIDKTLPTCNTTPVDSTWKRNGFVITGTCSDQGGSGCDETIISRNVYVGTGLNYIGNESPGTVKDKAGNSRTCDSVQVKIDTRGPECSVSGENTVWTNGNVTITYSGYDTGVGGAIQGGGYQSFTTGTVGVTTIPSYTLSDAFGNVTNCPARNVNVYIDHDAPSCSFIAKKDNSSGDTYTSNKWTSKNVYSTATCTDTTGACSSTKTVTTTGVTAHHTNAVKSSYTVKAKGKSTVTWTVYDAAGNSSTCSTLKVKKGVKDRDSSCGCETAKSCCVSYGWKPNENGTWETGLCLPSIPSGCPGGYQYKKWEGDKGECTGTGNTPAEKRACVRSCTKTERNESVCGCETYKECWHY